MPVTSLGLNIPYLVYGGDNNEKAMNQQYIYSANLYVSLLWFSYFNDLHVCVLGVTGTVLWYFTSTISLLST